MGVDHEGIVPDVMTVGKGIGGGFPLSGLISTRELDFRAAVRPPTGVSSSYGGNPLAAAAGLARSRSSWRRASRRTRTRVGASCSSA